MIRFVALLLLLPGMCLAALPPRTSLLAPADFRDGNYRLLASGHVSLLKFQPLEEADIAMECESTQPPQALATPHSWVASIPDDAKILVNFILGTDGQVYSPFVLDGAGSNSLDRKLINEVRHWQYRPALCNGVPADAEVKIQLSSH